MKKKPGFSTLLLIGLVMFFSDSCKKKEATEVNGNPYKGNTTAIFNSQLTYGTMTDQEGNIYKTIRIGSQTWMAENLRTSIYRNGKTIPVVTDSLEWCSLKTGAYCNYYNTQNSVHIATYGRLYNWYAVSDSNILAPQGWHVPASSEWDTLVTYLGGVNLSVAKLKEQGKNHWGNSNTSDNSSGFTALPGGCRMGYCYYMGLGDLGYWWSSTEFLDMDTAWYRSLTIMPDSISPWRWFKDAGFAIRCVKD